MVQKNLFGICWSLAINAQIWGTTGLLHMPTADMERDKTFKIGGNYLKKGTWGGNWPYDTWNYYLNITILS